MKRKQASQFAAIRLAVMILGVALVAAACGQSVFSLEVGQCFDDPDDSEVSRVETVDCAEPHDNEVFHLFDLADGDFPGTLAVQEQGGDGCFDAFEGYVGASYQDSIYDINALFPTADSWDDGDQEIVCYLVNFGGGTTTGTAKDSGR